MEVDPTSVHVVGQNHTLALDSANESDYPLKVSVQETKGNSSHSAFHCTAQAARHDGRGSKEVGERNKNSYKFWTKSMDSLTKRKGRDPENV